MSTLYEWADAARNIMAAIEDPYELAEAVETFLNSNDALQDKLDAYCAVIREMDARAEARNAEAKRLADLASADSARADFLRYRLMTFLQTIGRDKIETPHYRVSVVGNGGKVPILVNDEAAVPDRFWREVVTRQLDKDALREALEGGYLVPGAMLGTRGKRVVIK